MRKIIAICALSLGLAIAGNAQESAGKTSAVSSFKAGRTPIAIPPPTAEMTEIGYDNREFMEVAVPSQNRLIAAFVPTNDLAKLTSRSEDSALSRYAVVQVQRQLEYMDCEASDFKEVVDGMAEEFGSAMDATTAFTDSCIQEAEEEFNRRMKSLELEEATVNLGKPVSLGSFFSKQDAYGFGMVMPVSMGNVNVKMGMGGVLLRVRKRLLFVYLFSEYKDEDTVKWIRKTSEAWADAILKANK
jgi:hypothetical protein